MHTLGTARPKLLLAEDDAASARLLARVLAHAGYEVEPVLTGKVVLERVANAKFDVLICDWTLPDIDGIAVVRQVRLQAPTQPLIVLVSSFNSEGARQQALRAGADVYIAKPFEPLQLIELIAGSLARRREANESSAGTSTDFPPPSSSVQRPQLTNVQPTAAVKPSPAVIESTSAWRGLHALVASTLQEGIGLDMTFERGGLCESGQTISAAVYMVNVSHLIEVATALFVSWNSGVELARVVLRDPNPDDVAIRELLVEVGSNVLGTVKTALRHDGLLFTLALGQPGEMPLASSFARSFAATWVGGFSGPGVHITAVFGARSIAKVALPLRKLKENMVLAEDLMSDSGALILPAGSRLTSSTADRLGRQFAHRSVQVCVPPAVW